MNFFVLYLFTRLQSVFLKYFLHRRLYNGRIFFLSNRICNRLCNDYANQLTNCNCNCNHQILMIIVIVIVIKYFFWKVIVIVIVIVQFEPRLHISAMFYTFFSLNKIKLRSKFQIALFLGFQGRIFPWVLPARP